MNNAKKECLPVRSVTKAGQTALALNVYDFHARQYDPSIGRFLGVDPQGQFSSPYVGMGNIPTMGIDPDGEWLLSALKIATGAFLIINTVSAISEAFDGRGNFFEGLGTFAASFAVNTAADVGAVAAGALNTVNGVLTGTIAAVQGDFDGAGQALKSAFASPFAADIATLKNGGIKGLAASGVNSFVASVNAYQLGWNKALGDGSHSYEGTYSIGGGKKALVWTKPNRGNSTATAFGNSIALREAYFNLGPRFGLTAQERKQAVFLHESVHVRQQLKYGTGGQISRFLKTIEPGIGNSAIVNQAIRRYGDGKGTNLLEIEAEIEEIRFRGSKYFWSGIPVF